MGENISGLNQHHWVINHEYQPAGQVMLTDAVVAPV